MHLAEPRSIIAVLSETFSDGARAFGYQRIVSGVAGGKLGDDTACVRVVIATRDQRRTRRRAERRRVEHVVAKSTVRNALEVRRLNGSTECTARSESDIIRKDQENVWSVRLPLGNQAPNPLPSARSCP